MSAYSDKVIADGAVAYWRLNELSGTTAASLVGSYPGTISGGVTLGQPGALSDGDKAMAFDGSTGYINVPNTAALQVVGDLTLEFWINAVSRAIRGTALSKFYSNEYEITVHTDGSLYFYCGASAESIVSNPNDVALNKWTHVVGTRVAATKTLTLYVNGVPVKTGTYTAAIASSVNPVRIATNQGLVQWVNGLMDDVAIYPTALTPRQIADHYAAASLPAPGTAPYAPLTLPAAKPPHTQWTPLTPSDIVDSPFSALWVGGAGTVAAVGLDGRVVTFAGVQAGTRLRIAGRRVNDTATTATNLLALGRV